MVARTTLALASVLLLVLVQGLSVLGQGDDAEIQRLDQAYQKCCLKLRQLRRMSLCESCYDKVPPTPTTVKVFVVYKNSLGSDCVRTHFGCISAKSDESAESAE